MKKSIMLVVVTLVYIYMNKTLNMYRLWTLKCVKTIGLGLHVMNPGISHVRLTCWYIETGLQNHRCLPKKKRQHKYKMFRHLQVKLCECIYKKHTHMSHITSVPYPSEYLVTITLFFPQCSHSSVSWEQRVERRRRRVRRWLNYVINKYIDLKKLTAPWTVPLKHAAKSTQTAAEI